jgi:hypothetical protein
MSHVFTDLQINEIETILSSPRFARYVAYSGGNRRKAMRLYSWNTNISAAFYLLLHYCELSVRNAAVEAIEIEFGANWHNNRGFGYTLPTLNRGRGYQPKKNLVKCSRGGATAGQVVANLNFVFWQYIFTSGQDSRLWNKHLTNVFPGHDSTLTIAKTRGQVYNDIEQVRKLRNRIAHHEPIYNRNLDDDKDAICRLISLRCPNTEQWLDGMQTVTGFLNCRP